MAGAFRACPGATRHRESLERVYREILGLYAAAENFKTSHDSNLRSRQRQRPGRNRLLTTPSTGRTSRQFESSRVELLGTY